MCVHCVNSKIYSIFSFKKGTEKCIVTQQFEVKSFEKFSGEFFEVLKKEDDHNSQFWPCSMMLFVNFHRYTSGKRISPEMLLLLLRFKVYINHYEDMVILCVLKYLLVFSVAYCISSWFENIKGKF